MLSLLLSFVSFLFIIFFFQDSSFYSCQDFQIAFCYEPVFVCDLAKPWHVRSNSRLEQAGGVVSAHTVLSEALRTLEVGLVAIIH